MNDGSACGGTINPPTRCDNASYLDELEQGIYPFEPTYSLRSQYIEVWETNAIPFSNATQRAHQELFTPP